MNKLICYCFGYTKEDIEADIIHYKGQSIILKKIIENRKNGRCRCDTTHPEKR